MSKGKEGIARPVSAGFKGHQPRLALDGHQPNGVATSFPGKVQGGYQPTTGQAAPATPPNQGTSGKK